MTTFEFRATRVGATLAVLAGTASYGCVDQPSPTPASPDRDAAVVTISAALVTSPATWHNLWGSWPAARYEFGVAYDSDRQEIVVQGGRLNTSGDAGGDTWVWNGARGSWTEQTPSEGNNFPRVGNAMVYDPVRKKTLLFGGWQPSGMLFLGDTWEWDGATQTWTERTPSTAPSARYGHAMVWDPDRQRVVLFGGKDLNNQRKNDLWEWDGASATWMTRAQGGTIPTARYGHKMAYDVVRKTVVLRSGNTGTVDPGSWTNDTYEWDEPTSTWTKPTPTGSPNYYSNGWDKVAFDSERSKVVVYSGYYPNMFEWNPVAPQSWNVLTMPSTGGPAYDGELVFDASQHQMVVFGGQTVRTLWQWDNAALLWINRSTPFSGPLQRTGPSLAFDAMRGKLLVFGGLAASTYYNDIQEWSHVDATFTNKTNPAGTRPDGRQQSAMVYDSKRDRILLYGGTGATTFNDFWQMNPTTHAWTLIPITTTPRPPATYNQNLFYDVVGDKLLMVANSGYIPIWQADLATGLWTDRSVPYSTALAELYGHVSYAMAFDPDRRKVVMFGGYYLSKDTADIFEFDVVSGTWAKRDTPVGPVPGGRKFAALSYDPGRRVMVMFGGQGGVTGVYGYDALSDSWEWDGTSNTWTETTPDPVRPLARYSHDMIYDPTRGTMLVFGGTVPADTTYGLSEIWEYFPNSAPRPNGAGCSTATASRCASGFCVDGVCCAAASCPSTCQACNVEGPSKGTCASVPAGNTDDTCAADQACDAAQKCKSRNGLACAGFADCASGHCVDGVCCESDCTDTCKACNLTGKRGVCSNIGVGVEDPVAAPTCVSDPMQGRACDGTGNCSNLPRPLGSLCTASGQCAGGRCIDGVCCNSTCTQTCYACNLPTAMGTCSLLPAGQQDHSALTTAGVPTSCDGSNQYCASGACQMNKKPNGGTCTAAADCGSTFCVDGYCCNSACVGTCQGCNVPGKLGSCVNLAAGSVDMNATVACAMGQYCDSAGTCQSGLKANGVTCTAPVQCGSGNCVDGYCCDSACASPCTACNVASNEGTCTAVTPGGTDPTANPACASPNYCINGGCTVGRKPNGASCKLGNECGSNNCVDETCCENSCGGRCLTCKNATGTCTLATAGTDIRQDCGTGDCAGTCSGEGSCNYPASGKQCGQAGCLSDGVIHQKGMCDGAGNCANDVVVTMNCNGFRCYHDATDNTDKCATSCATDPNCQIPNFCDDTQHCPADFDNGHNCTRDSQCQSNHCAIAPGDTSGVCCDRDCRACGTCNLPDTMGTCVPTPAGTDPHHDCIDSASDPTGVCGGKCNGQWGCEFPAAGTTCGTCKQCDGASKCSVKPEDDDACGVIDCDQLDTSCMDYRDLQRNRCASLGVCKAANTTTACTDVMVSCVPDAGGGADAMSMPDGAGSDDASVPPPKSGGGGCGCEVATGDGRGGLSTLAGLFLAAGLIAGRRRPGRSRRG
ncbi:MAG TPA: kelch repeat-containing protein [Polyangia bacterium]|nr:kelch repeat-containing protein [Polyangia bacterium]